ncbi:MAG: replicative DNA helicase [Lachnospirales bacterium]
MDTDKITDFKTMPKDINAEEAFLSSMLFDEEGMQQGVTMLSPKDFYIASNRVLYSAMQTLHHSNTTVDIILLADYLKKIGEFEKIGGMEYLTKIMSAAATTTNIKSYGDIIEEKSVLRRLINSAKKIEEESLKNEKSVDDIIEIAQNDIFNIVENKKSEDFSHIEKILFDSMANIQELYNSGSTLTGLKTKFEDFDKKTAGLQKADLILIAARPSMGKTAFALNIAQNVAMQEGKYVAIFSLEMAKEQLVNRMLCSQAMVDSNKLRTGRLDPEDWQKIARSVKPISSSQVYIDDTPGITVPELRSKCRKLKMEKGLDLIVIDYLQLMNGTGKNESRQMEVSNISRALKAVAREMDAPVVALSQLSRANEKRIDKRPILSDLRDSGAIEQDADLVIFLHREEYYDPETEDKGMAEVIIAKQRNGETGSIKLNWQGQYTRFTDAEKIYV